MTKGVAALFSVRRLAWWFTVLAADVRMFMTILSIKSHPPKKQISGLKK